ncbi:MAG: hypothetical protein GY905_00810, partial [Gammaproteobacteria bacterium]|nr:hypothetical protein [Gammaproteobacteria bacterium]
MTSLNATINAQEMLAELKAKQVAGTITDAELELLSELEAQLAEQAEQEESKEKDGVKEEASTAAGVAETNQPESLEPEGDITALSDVGYSLPLAGLGLLGLSAGGSSGGSVVASTSSASFSGSVINGYVQGANVFQDTNDNGIFDDGEPNDTTDEDGAFSLQGYVPNGGSIIAAPNANTIDTTTGVAVTTAFRGGADTEVISPMTTLLETTDLTEAQLKTAFGLDSDVDLHNFDPIASALADDASADKVADALHYKAVSTSISNLLDLGSETLASGNTTAAQGVKAVAQAIESAIQDASGGPVNLGNATTIQTIVVNAEQKAPMADETIDFSSVASSVSTQLAAVNQSMITSASGDSANPNALLNDMYRSAKFAQTTLSSKMTEVMEADAAERAEKLKAIDDLNVETEINNTVIEAGNLVVNGTFETTDGWSGNAASVRENEGFNYANVEAAGNAWDVNLSYVLSLAEDTSYQLSFRAKGTDGRALTAGLGLNKAPYSSSTENLTLTEEWQTYTIQINEINFGGDDSRVIFDMGHDVGEVLIDDVELISSASTATPATAPTAAATAPTVTDADAISLYSDTLASDNVVTNLNPGWGQSGSLGAATDVDSAVGNVLKFTSLNYQGIELNSTDVSAKESLHLDLWSETAGKVKLFLVSTDGSASSEAGIVLDVTAGQWNSYDIDLDAFSGVDLASVFQMKFDSQSAVIGSDDGLSNFYMDNLYFSDTTATVGTPTAGPDATPALEGLTYTFEDDITAAEYRNWDGVTRSIESKTEVDQSSRSTLAVVKAVDSAWHSGLWLVDEYRNTDLIGDGSDPVTMRVYAEQDGSLTLTLSGEGKEYNTPTASVSQGWNDVSFAVSGADSATKWHAAILRPDSSWPTAGNSATVETKYYIDDVNFPQGDVVEWPAQPTSADFNAGATTPDEAVDDVVSLYSDEYTSALDGVAMTSWADGTMSEITIDNSNKIQKFEKTTYAGFDVPGDVTVAGMDTMSISLWRTDDGSKFEIKLVDLNTSKDGFYYIPADQLPKDQWVTVEIPLSDFNVGGENTGVALPSGHTISQLVLKPMGGSETFFVDDFFLSDSGTSTAPAAPTAGPDAPTAVAGDVISVFSDSYTEPATVNMRTSWSSGTAEDVVLGSNTVKKWTDLSYIGIEPASTIDASTMATFNVTVWKTDASSDLKVKLVDYVSGSWNADTNVEHELILSSANGYDIGTGEWVDISLNLSDFTGLTSQSNIGQIIIGGTKDGAASLETVYIDDIYFGPGTSTTPAAPTAAATAPTAAAADVISVFSDSYTEPATVNMRTSWSSGTAEDVVLGSNTVKKWSDLD